VRSACRAMKPNPCSMATPASAMSERRYDYSDHTSGRSNDLSGQQWETEGG
jgi:hypothetical protein